MAAGNLSDLPTVNRQVGAYTVSLRNDFQNIVNFNANLTTLGGSFYLQSLGMGASDADAIVAAFGNLAQLANIYIGAAYAGPTLPFAFRDNTNGFWGGQ